MNKENIVKDCRTCGYKSGNTCMLSGFATLIERKYPSRCGVHFENWVPIPPRPPRIGLFRRIIIYFFGK